jgi:hypothetical protein
LLLVDNRGAARPFHGTEEFGLSVEAIIDLF